MIIKTIVPKLGETFQYLGKPVTNEQGVRIGSIIDVKDAGDHYDLYMHFEDNELIIEPKYFNNAVMGEVYDFGDPNIKGGEK